MNKRYYRLYLHAVLCYWREEWTDVQDDETFEFTVRPALNQLIKNCFDTNTNVPNAAKEVSLFTKINAENF